MGGWIGGQAEYVMVPYADFSALVLTENYTREQILDRIEDIACLAGVCFVRSLCCGLKKNVRYFPNWIPRVRLCRFTRRNLCCFSFFFQGVKTGSVVYIAGAGLVGLAAAASAQLLGASKVS